MGDIQNPHDAFVRSVFQEKENAMDLIRSALPQDIVNRLDLASLDVIDASFVDEEQRQSQGDLLFSISLNPAGGHVSAEKESNRDLQIYCLIEHKSYLDPGIYMQLIEYLARIYRRQWTTIRWFSPVIPLVFYHGEKEWNLGNRLLEQMVQNSGLGGEDLEVLSRYIPDFGIELFNVRKIDPATLPVSEPVQLYLASVAFIRDPGVFEHLIPYLERQGNIDDIGKKVEVVARVLQYIFNVQDVESGAVSEALKMAGFSTEESEGVMATTADKLRAEGKAEGKLEGKLEAARRMRDKGIDGPTISEITGLSLEELKKYQIID
ncbi:MAG: Rpn family recombination-promoting nuclease/putative transposase [Leptospiraceae bacterium]